RDGERVDDLRWLFELRVKRAEKAEKIGIFKEWARLEEERFSSPERAASAYRGLLELDGSDAETLYSLARLCMRGGEFKEAAELLERDRDLREGAERATREVELARLYTDSLKRPGAALEAARRALELVPGDGRAVAIVEELLARAETRAGAATILESNYASVG